MDSQKEYQREYYERHRERLLQNSKDYYNEFRVEILSKQNKKNKESEIVTCKCGRKVKEICLSQHLNSTIHRRNLITKEK